MSTLRSTCIYHGVFRVVNDAQKTLTAAAEHEQNRFSRSDLAAEQNRLLHGCFMGCGMSHLVRAHGLRHTRHRHRNHHLRLRRLRVGHGLLRLDRAVAGRLSGDDRRGDMDVRLTLVLSTAFGTSVLAAAAPHAASNDGDDDDDRQPSYHTTLRFFLFTSMPFLTFHTSPLFVPYGVVVRCLHRLCDRTSHIVVEHRHRHRAEDSPAGALHKDRRFAATALFGHRSRGSHGGRLDTLFLKSAEN